GDRKIVREHDDSTILQYECAHRKWISANQHVGKQGGSIRYDHLADTRIAYARVIIEHRKLPAEHGDRSRGAGIARNAEQRPDVEAAAVHGTQALPIVQ